MWRVQLEYATVGPNEIARLVRARVVVDHSGEWPSINAAKRVSEFINDDKIMKYIDENWNRVIPHILDYNYTVPQEHRDRVSELMRKEYMGDAELARGNTDGFIQVTIALREIRFARSHVVSRQRIADNWSSATIGNIQSLVHTRSFGFKTRSGQKRKKSYCKINGYLLNIYY